jgi:hypothetical protein
MREQPEQSFFPRAAVYLSLRLDEGEAHDIPAPPKKPPHLRKGKGVDNKEGGLSVQKDGNAFVLRAPDQATGTPSLFSASSSDGRTHEIGPIVPVRFSVNRNGIRTADTCTLEFHFEDMPIDPRVIRSCAVEVYLGTITQEAYERQLGKRETPLPASWIDAAGRKRSNRRFQGWADEWRVSHRKGAISTVTIEATDNTRILLDQGAPPKLVVAADKPIDEAVADYLANFPQFRGFRVAYLPAGTEVPKLSAALAKTAFKPKLGPVPSGGAGGGAGGTAKVMVFDYLTDIAGTLGLIVRVQDTTIIFQRPRTLYAASFSGRPDDPFTGRILPSGREVPTRLYLAGRNIDDLEFNRKLTRFAPFNVEVRCFSPKLGRTLIARFPSTKEERQTHLVPGDSAEQRWIVQTVSGVESESALRAIAQGLYEQMGRQEMGSRFATISLASFGGGNMDPDTLDIQAGDAVQVEIARSNHHRDASVDTTGKIEDENANRAAEYMRERGFSEGFVKAYGRAMRQGFLSIFRVKTLALNYDAEQGVSFDFETTNFREIRSKDLPKGEEISPPPTDAKPVKVVVEDGAPGAALPTG